MQLTMLGTRQGLLAFFAFVTLVLLSLPSAARRNHAISLHDLHTGRPVDRTQRAADPVAKRVAVAFGSKAKATKYHYRRTSEEPPEGPPEYRAAWISGGCHLDRLRGDGREHTVFGKQDDS